MKVLISIMIRNLLTALVTILIILAAKFILGLCWTVFQIVITVIAISFIMTTIDCIAIKNKGDRK